MANQLTQEEQEALEKLRLQLIIEMNKGIMKVMADFAQRPDFANLSIGDVAYATGSALASCIYEEIRDRNSESMIPTPENLRTLSDSLNTFADGYAEKVQIFKDPAAFQKTVMNFEESEAEKSGAKTTLQ